MKETPNQVPPLNPFCSCTRKTPLSDRQACAENRPDPVALGLTTQEVCAQAGISPQMLNKLQRLEMFRTPPGRKRGVRQFYSHEDVQILRNIIFTRRILGPRAAKEIVRIESKLAPLIRPKGPGLGMLFRRGWLPHWLKVFPSSRRTMGRRYFRYLHLRRLIHWNIQSAAAACNARHDELLARGAQWD